MWGNKVSVKSVYSAVRRAKALGIEVKSPFIRVDNNFKGWNTLKNFYYGTEVCYKGSFYKVTDRLKNGGIMLKNRSKIIEVDKNTVIRTIKTYSDKIPRDFKNNT